MLAVVVAVLPWLVLSQRSLQAEQSPSLGQSNAVPNGNRAAPFSKVSQEVRKSTDCEQTVGTFSASIGNPAETGTVVGAGEYANYINLPSFRRLGSQEFRKQIGISEVQTKILGDISAEYMTVWHARSAEIYKVLADSPRGERMAREKEVSRKVGELGRETEKEFLRKA